MQNLVPDAMRLNTFVHVEIPDNSVLFLRVQGKSLPQVSSDVEHADFFSRKTEKLVQEEQQFLKDYQAEMNRLDSERESSQTQSEETGMADES